MHLKRYRYIKEGMGGKKDGENYDTLFISHINRMLRTHNSFFDKIADEINLCDVVCRNSVHTNKWHHIIQVQLILHRHGHDIRSIKIL